MLNIQQIFKLCDSYIIDIDRNDNNLINPNIEYFSNLMFTVDTDEHIFKFKIINNKNIKNKFQIQCLDTFKILILTNDGNLFFEDFFNINNNNIENTLFYAVYDNIAITFFPSNNTNLILCFNDKLYLKSINDDFMDNDQTIFLYGEMSYNVKIITTNLEFFDFNKEKYMININDIKGVFDFISKNYQSLPEKIFIQLNKSSIPFEFFYQTAMPTFLDRIFDLTNRTINRRIYNYKSILDIDMECQNSEIDYYDRKSSQTVEQLLPRNDEIIIIWTKLINSQIPTPIYYNSSGTYLIDKSYILNKPLIYYNKIIALLEKKNDQRIFNLFQFSLYTIFFVNS